MKSSTRLEHIKQIFYASISRKNISLLAMGLMKVWLEKIKRSYGKTLYFWDIFSLCEQEMQLLTWAGDGSGLERKQRLVLRARERHSDRFVWLVSHGLHHSSQGKRERVREDSAGEYRQRWLLSLIRTVAVRRQLEHYHTNFNCLTGPINSHKTTIYIFGCYLDASPRLPSHDWFHKEAFESMNSLPF